MRSNLRSAGYCVFMSTTQLIGCVGCDWSRPTPRQFIGGYSPTPQGKVLHKRGCRRPPNDDGDVRTTNLRLPYLAEEAHVLRY